MFASNYVMSFLCYICSFIFIYLIRHLQESENKKFVNYFCTDINLTTSPLFKYTSYASRPRLLETEPKWFVFEIS